MPTESNQTAACTLCDEAWWRDKSALITSDTPQASEDKTLTRNAPIVVGTLKQSDVVSPEPEAQNFQTEREATP